MLGGMVAILVIDPEPTYRAYWTTKGADTVCTLAAALALIESRPPYDRVIVSSLLMDYSIHELVIRGCRVEVATATPRISEAVAAYRAGASDYFTKSF